ncbi:MAG TPA: TPM domain-containing protein [Ignavibacteria bacterium]|nr:TPM domain-containing protein [Ignavibacteria bacterium]
MAYNFLKYFLVFFLFVTSAGLFAQRSKSVPDEIKVKTYVTDKTSTLNSVQLKSLEQKLAAFEKETSNQVVVWMESSLDGNSVEDRSYEIAEQNGIGQKQKNNGVLLYIAKNDRKLRIEVGYGLEGALTDALCSQIIRNEITPNFKKGNFFDGINAGVDAIIKATKGEYAAEKETNKDNPFGNLCCLPLPLMFFIIIVGFIIVMKILSRIFRWGRGSNRSNWWWTGGSGSGSSWSSGSSDWSGGGFSGGGGSFGGGGSSGSW